LARRIAGLVLWPKRIEVLECASRFVNRLGNLSEDRVASGAQIAENFTHYFQHFG